MILPDQVLALVATVLPSQPIDAIEATAGGFSHRSALATIGGRQYIIKAADAAAKRAALRHEARMLGLLARAEIAVSKLVAYVEDDRWSVTIGQACAGSSGMLLYQRPDLLPGAYHQLGQALASLHGAPLVAPAADLLLAERARQVALLLPTLGLPPKLAGLLNASLAHPAWQLAPARLVHGDAGLHNLLWDNRITALIDWEWSGWGNPLLDLAWVYWTMRWRAVAPALWPAFLAGYQSGLPAGSQLQPIDQASMRALVFGQIASLLARSHDQPAARAEWLRRAAWTIELDIPS